MAALTGADRVHEFPVVVVSLGDAEPALRAEGPAAAGAVDRAPLEVPLITAAQRAGEGDRLGRPWDRGRPVDVPLLPATPVDGVITARGSQRRMTRAAACPRTCFAPV